MGKLTNTLYAGIAALAIAGGMASPAYAQKADSQSTYGALRPRLESIVRTDGSKLSWEGCVTKRDSGTSCIPSFIKGGRAMGKSPDELYAYANDLAQMTDCRGKYLFSGALIYYFQNRSGTVGDATLFSFISKGDRCLEASDMLLAKEYNMGPGEIQRIVEGASMAQSTPALVIKSKLGEISYGLEVLSTPYRNRPSALIILPAKDYNGAFFTQSRIALFDKLRKSYRTRFGVADRKSSFFSIMGTVEGLKFVYMAGHGEYGKGFSRLHFQDAGKSVQAKEPLWSIMEKRKREERASIGPEDTGLLEKSFKKVMAKGGIIVADSCGSATGPRELSVGNALVQAAPEESTVIMSKGSHTEITGLEGDLKEIKFRNQHGDDLTFTVDIPPTGKVSPIEEMAGHILELSKRRD
ncbi:TPA: hypothetical protein HA295_05490 [Candidatus Woesearchaeota archaeon]|nr:hypothetical protein [Candidatus Woesearchaeota archaeon]